MNRAEKKTTINTAIVYTNYGVGSYIVENEQQGEQRAAYGKAVLKRVSEKLTDKYGEGWSVETLKKCRKFFQIYSPVTGSIPKKSIKIGLQCRPNSSIHSFLVSLSRSYAYKER